MIPYTEEPAKFLLLDGIRIASFLTRNEENLDERTVESFGKEWNRFSHFTEEELKIGGEQYFDIVTPGMLHPGTIALDIGCGTGRWSKFISGKIGFIESVDPSSAVYVASKFTEGIPNIRVTQAGVNHLPFADESFDFIFSLGVLHHLPDTQEAIRKAVQKLRKGGHFLVYLYYNLDNRSIMFRILFFPVHLLRTVISELPFGIKTLVCDLFAVFVYIPLAALTRLVKKMFPAKNWYRKIPLSYYHDKSFKIMRNDSLDRLGTPLEKRFSREEIKKMLEVAGLKNIVFSEFEPYWHAVGEKQ